MKPPFAYYGGKNRLAPWIASLFPSHRVYVEPFAGSAAVLFEKAPARHEILNDVDGNVVTFLRVLRDRPDELEHVCRLTPYARDEFDRADLADPSIDELERARRWWVRVNQSFAKIGTGATGWSTSIKRGSNNARSQWNRMDRFLACAARLGTVTIENRDALDVVSEYSSPDGVIYADPPYLISTRSAMQWRPGGDYAHEFATEGEHRQLAAALCETPAVVFVSGYASGLYEELYAGWWRLERDVVRRTSNGRSSTLPGATEVVWTNRPIADRLFG